MASMRMSTTTPQRGLVTPQSYGRIPASVAKKETRNLKDKTCTKEMMQNLANVLSDFGYPEFVSIKEIQKIDKQNFIKYFNVINNCCVDLWNSKVMTLVYSIYFSILTAPTN